MEPLEYYRLLRRGVPTSPDRVPAEFVLHADDRIRVLWAPLDFINTDAKVAIVGITPGWQQTEIAYETAARALAQGRSYEHACREVKQAASFAGAMRKNLINMLDAVGLHAALGLSSVAALFDSPTRHLLHTTSALRFPVFRKGQNYTGHSPKPLSHPVLRSSVETVLAEELAAVPSALIVPLGKATSECVRHACRTSGLRPSVLDGFPHPSGANGHRVRQFEQERRHLEHQVQAWASTA